MKRRNPRTAWAGLRLFGKNCRRRAARKGGKERCFTGLVRNIAPRCLWMRANIAVCARQRSIWRTMFWRFPQSDALRPYLPVEGSGVVVGRFAGKPGVSAVGSALCRWQNSGERMGRLPIVANERFLLVAGSDRPGAMWGVYALSRHALGVDPCYRFTGSHPAKRESLSLEEGITAGGPRTFRFRGWFLNDEDLLSDWRDGGGARPHRLSLLRAGDAS